MNLVQNYLCKRRFKKLKKEIKQFHLDHCLTKDGIRQYIGDIIYLSELSESADPSTRAKYNKQLEDQICVAIDHILSRNGVNHD